MRVLILCLLIGSITCYPGPKEYGGNRADAGFMRPPFSSGFWYSGTGVSSDPGSSSSLPSLPNPNSNKATGLPAPQDGISSAPEMKPLPTWHDGAVLFAQPDSSPDVSSSGTNMAAGNSFDGGHASFSDEGPEAGEYAGYGPDSSAPGGSDDGSSSVDEGNSWRSGSASGYDAGQENYEPVLSDVSDLEPVYSYKSRSSYQRGRKVFAQTRYTPFEPAPQYKPAPRRVSKTSRQSDPVKAPSKGGY